MNSNTYLPKALGEVFKTVLDCLQILLHQCTTQRNIFVNEQMSFYVTTAKTLVDGEFFVFFSYTQSWTWSLVNYFVMQLM